MTNRLIVSTIPAVQAFTYTVFAIVGGGYKYLKALSSNPQWGYLVAHLILILPIAVSVVYYFIVSKQIGKQKENSIPVLPIISYGLVLGIAILWNGVLSTTPLRLTTLFGQIGVCSSMLLLGNCFSWQYYVPANIIYILLLVAASIIEGIWSGTSNNFFMSVGDKSYYMTGGVTVFMIMATLINRLYEIEAIKTYKIVCDLKWAKMHDPLTGAYNRSMLRRKYFDDHFFVMLDIDHFKHVNDTYGHEMGDRVLKAMTKIVKRNMRSGDSLIRYGGEEFIILVDGTSTKQDMLDFANRIRIDVANSTSKVLDVDDPDYIVPVTISMGIGYADPKFTLEENISVADKYLYEAKETGRNKVVSVLNTQNPKLRFK